MGHMHAYTYTYIPIHTFTFTHLLAPASACSSASQRWRASFFSVTRAVVPSSCSVSRCIFSGLRFLFLFILFILFYVFIYLFIIFNYLFYLLINLCIYLLRGYVGDSVSQRGKRPAWGRAPRNPPQKR